MHVAACMWYARDPRWYYAAWPCLCTGHAPVVILQTAFPGLNTPFKIWPTVRILQTSHLMRHPFAGLPGQSTALQTSHSHPRAQPHGAASQPPEQPKAEGDSPFQDPPTSLPLAVADRTTHITRFGMESQGAAASASTSALGSATAGALPGSAASEGDGPALPGLIGAGVVVGAQGGVPRSGSNSSKRGSKALWLAAAAKTGAVSDGGRLKMRVRQQGKAARTLMRRAVVQC